jgi:hypothetical protein
VLTCKIARLQPEPFDTQLFVSGCHFQTVTGPGR